MDQIMAKRGTDSSFVVKANIKALEPKLSRSRLVKMMNWVESNTESIIKY